MSYQRIGVIVLIAGLCLGILFFTGFDFGIPSVDGASGSMAIVFYDANGNPITNIAFISAGTVISGFSADWVISATGSVPLKTANLVGSYGYKLYGIDGSDKEHLLTSVEVNSFNVNDISPPISWHDENYHSINILEPYDYYRELGGWKIVVTVHGSVSAVNNDYETITGDVTATAWFAVWWQSGTLQLTGEIGVG